MAEMRTKTRVTRSGVEFLMPKTTAADKPLPYVVPVPGTVPVSNPALRPLEYVSLAGRRTVGVRELRFADLARAVPPADPDAGGVPM